MLGSEPALIIGAIDAGLIAVQQAAITMSNTAHVLVGAGIAVCGFVLTRSKVTPSM